MAEEPDVDLGEPDAELGEPDAELGEVDNTPVSSVPLALALSPLYVVAPTPVPLVHCPAWADVWKVMSAHWWWVR